MTDHRPPTEPPAYLLGPQPVAEPDRGYRRGLTHGLLIGGVVALVLAVLLGLSMFRGQSGSDGDSGDPQPPPPGEKFSVGGCVKQDRSEAVAIDCDDATDDDYRITDKVTSSGDCPDQTQPVIKEGDDVYCLAPYGG